MIRIAAITLASDSEIADARFRPSKFYTIFRRLLETPTPLVSKKVLQCTSNLYGSAPPPHLYLPGF